jgi:hypothetical protein
MTGDEIEGYFEGKPRSLDIFRIISNRIEALGPAQITVASQISFGAKRKFAWFWLYNVTRTDPNGVPHLMLAIDHEVQSDHVRQVSQVGKGRWNHQIVIRTREQAESKWLGDLLGLAHDFGIKA